MTIPMMADGSNKGSICYRRKPLKPEEVAYVITHYQ